MNVPSATALMTSAGTEGVTRKKNEKFESATSSILTRVSKTSRTSLEKKTYRKNEGEEKGVLTCSSPHPPVDVDLELRIREQLPGLELANDLNQNLESRASEVELSS